MAIKGAQTARNQATGMYHKIQRIEVMCSALEPEPRVLVVVGMYISEAARDNFPDAPLEQRNILFKLEDMIAAGFKDFREMAYDYIMQLPPFVDTNAVSDEVVTPSD